MGAHKGKVYAVGVVSYLCDHDDGSIRLIMDDVRGSSENPVQWDQICLFTHFDFDAQKLNSLQLSQEEYARIGENIILRVLALMNRV